LGTHGNPVVIPGTRTKCQRIKAAEKFRLLYLDIGVKIDGPVALAEFQIPYIQGACRYYKNRKYRPNQKSFHILLSIVLHCFYRRITRP
jgi:hypothetical protein